MPGRHRRDRPDRSWLRTVRRAGGRGMRLLPVVYYSDQLLEQLPHWYERVSSLLHVGS